MTQEQTKKLVIFDFDGVLVNTVHFWFAIHKNANNDLTWERFESMSYGNFLQEQQKLLSEGSYKWPEGHEEKYIEALDTVFSIEDILHDSILGLSNRYILAIVSSASSTLISRFFKKENLDGCFSDILGFEEHSLKTVKIQSLLKKYNLAVTDAVFITDTLGDLLEANECKVSSIAVTWGLHKEPTLSKANPAYIIDNPQDLIGVVHKILQPNSIE